MAGAYPGDTDAASSRPTGDRQMRRLSFLLAFGLLLAGPSIAGSVERSLPGSGAFAYNGPSLLSVAPIQVATTR